MSQTTDQHGLLQHSCNLPLINQTSHPLRTQACHQALLHFIPLRKSQLQKFLPPRLELLEIKFLTTRKPKIHMWCLHPNCQLLLSSRKRKRQSPKLASIIQRARKGCCLQYTNQKPKCTLQGHQQPSPKRVLWWNNTNLPHSDFLWDSNS